jgi:hypothetical protein
MELSALTGGPGLLDARLLGSMFWQSSCSWKRASQKDGDDSTTRWDDDAAGEGAGLLAAAAAR